MIEVEMRTMSRTSRGEAERLDLAKRGILLAQMDAEQRPREARDAGVRRPVRMIDVAQALAGVDEDETVRIGLDEQAMVDEPPVGAPIARRTARA